IMEGKRASGSDVTVLEQQSQPTLVLRSSKAAVEVGRKAVGLIEKQLKDKKNRSAKDDLKIDEICKALESDIRSQISGLPKTLKDLSKEPQREEFESEDTFNKQMKKYEEENAILLQAIENLLSELEKIFGALLDKAKQALAKLPNTSDGDAREEVLSNFQNESENFSREIEKAVKRVLGTPSNLL
ncbi:hypothetical protein BaRGS_00035168, partial [Batillaria attramentaria]